MSFNDESEKKEFLAFVAAVFEENCLPLIENEADVEKCLLFAIDYCLDQKQKESGC